MEETVGGDYWRQEGRSCALAAKGLEWSSRRERAAWRGTGQELQQRGESARRYSVDSTAVDSNAVDDTTDEAVAGDLTRSGLCLQYNSVQMHLVQDRHGSGSIAIVPTLVFWCS